MKVKVKKKKLNTQTLRNPNCTDCKLSETAQFVCLMGQGPVPCRFMIVGEAPGFREDELGKPFSGKAGEKLDQLLGDVGLSRKDFYITNAVHCRPPDNRTPRRKEITCCEKYLRAEIEMVKPEIIVILGSVALQSLLKITGISKRHGEVITEDGISYFLSIHPAALFKQPNLEAYAKADFERLTRLIGGKLESVDDKLNYEIVRSYKDLRRCMYELSKEVEITYDIETEDTSIGSSIYLIGLGNMDKQWILPLNWPNSPFTHGTQRVIIKNLAIIFKDKKLIAQNGKFDNRQLTKAYGTKFDLKFDTMLASHLLDENTLNGLEAQCKLWFNAPDWKMEWPIDPDVYPFKELAKYNATDIYYTHKLFRLQQKKISEDERLRIFFNELTMPAARMLESMEDRGVQVDKEKYDNHAIEIKKRIEEKVGCLNRAAGRKDINWNSTQQVGRLFFDIMKMPVIETTKTGLPSIKESALRQLMREYPVAKQLLEYKEQFGLGKFIKSWSRFLDEDYKMYPSAKLTGTVTGRLSYSDPNLQQTPRDVFIRSMITAPEGWILFEADYSQIELRLAAQASQDSTMLKAFYGDQDIHLLTASLVTGKPFEDITEEERKKAKAINFGFIYGMGARKFVDYAFEKYDVSLTLAEAREFRDKFFRTYANLNSWHTRQKILVKKYQYVRTMMGRKRRLYEINSSDKFLRSEAERQAINSPIQGTASDMTLFSAVRIDRELPHNEIVVCGLIHDAILGWIKPECLEDRLNNIKDIMTDMRTINRIFHSRIDVPIKVGIKVGPWGLGTKF